MYRLYVDEVGNDDLGCVSDERHRYLSLTGVAMNLNHVRDYATPNLNRFKAAVFEHDPDHPVILHRKEILNRKGAFGLLKNPDKQTQFDSGLLSYLRETEYTVTTIFIDKKAMLAKTYWTQKHPYHYLMEILIEKYVQWLERKGDAIGDVMPEMRRGKKDEALQAAFQRVRLFGTNFVPPNRIQSRLRSKHLKFRAKAENITGLQIADLVAHPSHTYIRRSRAHPVEFGPFGAQVADILRASKYDRSAGGYLYGYKYLP